MRGHMAGRCEPRLVARRRFLGWALSSVAALGVSAIAPSARGAGAGKLVRSESSKEGVTLFFALDRAPFPKGSKYDDPTVAVFVPSYYRLPKNRRADVVMFFHGHHANVVMVMNGQQLREQMHASKQNAILVVPQLAKHAADSSAGQLENKRGLSRMVSEMFQELRRDAVGKLLGKTSLAGVKDVGMLCIGAHSGGYRAAAHCLKHGGTNVNETYLFDSLYGEVDVFREWVVKRKGSKGRKRHKLISQYAGGEVRTNNIELMAQLKAAGVKCHHETKPGELTRAQMTKGRAIFMGTQVSHGNVSFRQNNLRDCLYASGLKRHVESDWFEGKNQARKIDYR